ncbi:TRAP transporter small permease subunit [Acidimangrovimonas sediminis]|uniref:TRAP transporter small permease subunit n=1 Tax=Acidimangrovimonas sediminis TaxID=2056283 RepID=UPI000C7FB85D|nr:TRAP transporter small permease subunit [Acidimangrovimonas sediminis]
MGGLLAFSRGIDRVNAAIGKFVGWLILLAILVSAVNATVRKVFDVSSNAWLELQWYLFGAAFMGAAAYTLQQNEHIRIDIVYGLWKRRRQHWIDLIGHVLFLLPFTVLMIVYLTPWVMLSLRSGEMSTNAGGLILWPAKSFLLIGFVQLFFQAISEIIKKVAVMRGLIEDPSPFVSSHDAAEMEGAAYLEGHDIEAQQEEIRK